MWEVEGVKRVLSPGMSAKDQVLLLLHQSSGWIAFDQLLKWVEYSNGSMFHSNVLLVLHKLRLIEFDQGAERARIPPLGSKEVEQGIMKPRT
jgi:hypothetical protein